MSSKNKCRVCGKAFTTSIALKQHMKAVHRGHYYGIRLSILGAVIAIISITTIFLAIHQLFPITNLAVTTNTPTTNLTTMITTSKQTSSPLTKTSSKQAPDFTLPEIDPSGLTGNTISLSQFGGRSVFLEFMSPLCGHCIKMTPIIKELEEKYGDRVIFISIMYGDPSSKSFQDIASEFLKKHGLNWIHIVDDGKVFKSYGVEGTPTYVILNREHIEVNRFKGSGTTKEQLEDALENALQ